MEKLKNPLPQHTITALLSRVFLESTRDRLSCLLCLTSVLLITLKTFYFGDILVTVVICLLSSLINHHQKVPSWTGPNLGWPCLMLKDSGLFCVTYSIALIFTPDLWVNCTNCGIQHSVLFGFISVPLGICFVFLSCSFSTICVFFNILVLFLVFAHRSFLFHC